MKIISFFYAKVLDHYWALKSTVAKDIPAVEK